METMTIGGVEIAVEAGGSDVEGRTIFTYTLKGEGIDYEASDLKSGCGAGGREDRDGMESLLSFLGAAAESYRYHDGMRKDSNTDLFPRKVCRWASENSDEISILAFDYEHGRETP
jgi:hypothetical protein